MAVAWQFDDSETWDIRALTDAEVSELHELPIPNRPPLDEAAVASRFGAGLAHDASAVDAAKALQADYTKGWADDLALWRSGDIDLVEFEQRRYDAIATHFDAIYREGLKAAGRSRFTPLDGRIVRASVNAEQQFLGGFIRDMRNGAGVMPYERRAAMYAASGSGFYLRGEMAGLDVKWTDINWVKHANESCGDCIALADGGPYSPLSIATYPRSGSTQCKANCLCTLEYVKRDRPRGGYPSVEQAADAGLNVPVPDIAVAPIRDDATRIAKERIDAEVAKIEARFADLIEEQQAALDKVRADRSAVEDLWESGAIDSAERRARMDRINAAHQKEKDAFTARADEVAEQIDALPDPSRALADAMTVDAETAEAVEDLVQILDREIAALGTPPPHPLANDAGTLIAPLDRALDPDQGPIAPVNGDE